jgi:hypothetical protein
VVGVKDWVVRIFKTKGFKAAIIAGGVTGVICGGVEAGVLFGFELVSAEVASSFPFGGLMAEELFGHDFWLCLAVAMAGCILMGLVGGGVAVAIVARRGKGLTFPIIDGVAGGMAGGVLVFFVMILGLAKWDFRGAVYIFDMLRAIPLVLVGFLVKLLGYLM